MSRKMLNFALVAVVAVFGSVLASAAQAGCGGGYGGGYGGYGYGGYGYSSYSYRTCHRPVVHAPAIAVIPLVKKVVHHDHHKNLTAVPAGSTLTLPSNFLGVHPGSVFLTFANIKLPVQIVNWTESGVTIKLPPMAIRHDVMVRIDVILPHGKIAHTQHLLVKPPAAVVLHPVLPTSPLPTQDALSVQQ